MRAQDNYVRVARARVVIIQRGPTKRDHRKSDASVLARFGLAIASRFLLNPDNPGAIRHTAYLAI